MAESLDVSARLAEGRPAVDNIGDYVWACHLLGYQNADLTLHPAQVRDWYSSEDGLDLRALDADRAAMDAAASAAESARRLQEQQFGALSGAWQGRGGDATHEFLVRHGGASAAATSAVRDAVDALTSLRDELWRAVDEKVGTAVAIDDRRQTERPHWLAATRTVTTGTGDRAVASELIDQQVKPFVDNDIRSDWVAAMQRAMAAIAAAFDAATGALTTEPSAAFDVPGDLGPLPPSPPGSAQPVETAGTAPAAWPSPPQQAPPSVGPMTPAASPFPAAQDPVAAPMPAAAMPAPVPAAAPAGATAPAMPAMPSLGDLGGGLTGGAGGLAGLGQQIADAIGGLLNQPDDALADPPDSRDDTADDAAPIDKADAAAADDKPADPGEKPDDAAATTGDVSDAGKKPCADEPVVESSSEEEPVPPPPPEPVPTPPPAPMPSPPPIVAPPPAQELAGVETPCEIAADELPQAGP
jgi:hypothetical protein